MPPAGAEGVSPTVTKTVVVEENEVTSSAAGGTVTYSVRVSVTTTSWRLAWPLAVTVTVTGSHASPPLAKLDGVGAAGAALLPAKVKDWAASPASQAATSRVAPLEVRQEPCWLAGVRLWVSASWSRANSCESVTAPPVELSAGATYCPCCPPSQLTAIGTTATRKKKNLVAGSTTRVEIEAGLGLQRQG